MKGILSSALPRKKLFIKDGCCIRSECNFKDSFGKPKVLLPESLISDFRTPIPTKRIGQIVICFRHFFFTHQKHYFDHGSFPEGARLKAKGGNSVAHDKPIPAARSYIKGKELKVSERALLHDNDWVSNSQSLILDCHDAIYRAIYVKIHSNNLRSKN